MRRRFHPAAEQLVRSERAMRDIFRSSVIDRVAAHTLGKAFTGGMGHGSGSRHHARLFGSGFLEGGILP